MSNWDESWDFICIGSGAGGVIAAMTVKAQGGEPLILESTDKFGGSTAISGGVMWIPMHPVMQKEGAKDSYDMASAYLDGCAGEPGPGSTPAVRRAYLETGPEMIGFLQRQGMRFMYPKGYADYHEAEIPGGHPGGRSILPEIFDLNRLGAFKEEFRTVARPPVRGREPAMASIWGRTWASRMAILRIGWRTLQNRWLARDLAGTGPALQGRLYEILLRNKVAMRRNAVISELVVEHDRVVGVVVSMNGKAMRLRAKKGVLIAAGGFAQNSGMRRQFQPELGGSQWSAASPGDEGAMLRLAVGMGAQTALMDQSWWTPLSIGPDGNKLFHTSDMSKPHCILVDAKGQRFVNESTSYVAIGNMMFEHNKTTPAIPSWAIFDSNHREKYFWGMALPKKTPQAWLDSGYLKKADTLSELAQLCGIDPEGLVATVSRFNQFAAAGEDLDFGRGLSAFAHHFGDPSHKPNGNLGALEKPPFYGVAVVPGDVGTSGGIVCDELARVVKQNGALIDGLYAAGNATASLMGHSYPGAGASIGASAVFGYIAAKHAMR